MTEELDAAEAAARRFARMLGDTSDAIAEAYPFNEMLRQAAERILQSRRERCEMCDFFQRVDVQSRRIDELETELALRDQEIAILKSMLGLPRDDAE